MTMPSPTPVLRIFFRYMLGYMLGQGILPPELAQMLSEDPEIMAMLDMAAGGAGVLIIEGWYWLAHRYGWAK